MEGRPFSNIDDMNQAMIDNYKASVKEGDVVIWAGDVTFGGNERFLEEIWSQLSYAYNILVVGNHDFKKGSIRNLDFDESHLFLYFIKDGKEIVVSHFPFESKVPGICNIHGHLHSKTFSLGLNSHINVSVEQTGYRPVLLSELFT